VVNERERLTVIILHVADLEVSLRFYRELIGVPLELGLNEPADDPWIGGHHAELSWRAGAYLHFALFAARPGQRTTAGAEIGLHVEDVLVIHRRMVAGAATVLHEPRREPWGLTARYRDPDGNIVGITSRR
jgi:lactoylglutathione lyase